MDLTTLSISELKALAYDQLVVLEQTKNNITVLNQRIAQLQTEEKNAVQV